MVQKQPNDIYLLGMRMKVYAKATEKVKREAVSVLPFAQASPPEHVYPVQFEHAARTEAKKTRNTQQNARRMKAN